MDLGRVPKVAESEYKAYAALSLNQNELAQSHSMLQIEKTREVLQMNEKLTQSRASSAWKNLE